MVSRHTAHASTQQGGNNTMNTIKKTGILTLALGAGMGLSTVVSSAQAAPAPQIYVNNALLRPEVSPINQNGRVLVPMRSIFEQLGATVNYNSLNQSIVATKGETVIRMALGSRNAMVNNLPVKLDSAARAYYGRTLVPLRFVSEALGANVDYNSNTRTVLINGSGMSSGQGGTQVAGARTISIPAESVVPVTLDQEISSENAYVGQNFTATVVSAQAGDSEFPQGTKIRGKVTQVQRKNGSNPGVLELGFSQAVLPDNSSVNLNGALISLDNDSIKTVGGRVIATGSKGNNDTLKVVGIGAGAGYVIGRLLKKNGTVAALLGAAGGYLYDKSKGDKANEARLAAGSKFGVRLKNGVSYRDTTGYASERSNYVRL